jgi:TRAP-type C4-dicarboxylate transport system permease small subunit
MRNFLDALYRGSLYLSAACLAGIGAMVGLQLGGRIVDGALKLLGLPVLGLVVLSLAEICGYLLAVASFLALAPTLKAGAHIRVTMVLSALAETKRRFVEIWAFGASTVASAYLTYQLANFAWVSFLFSEVSAGVVRVPLGYPQAAMALGALVLTIALLDETWIVITRGRPTFRVTEDAISLGKEG